MTDAHRFKADNGKPRWSLIPARAMLKLLWVAEFGAKRYAARSWREVPNAKERYWESLSRHFHAVNLAVQEQGFGALMEESDDGLPHLAQLGFDALILIDLSLMESPP